MNCNCGCDESRTVCLESPVREECPDIRVCDTQGQFLKVKSLKLNDNGNIVAVTFDTCSLMGGEDGEGVLLAEDVVIEQNFLHVPGVGFIPPGAVVRYQDKDWLLMFGWHTNYSNQTIYSWFMRPLNVEGQKNPCDRTVYKDMIDYIDLIHYR